MTTTKTLGDIAEEINAILPECIEHYGRKQGEFTPIMQFENRPNQYKGFLSDWSGDCRDALRAGLRQAGWEVVKYAALYHWSVQRDGFEFQYIEGDLYLYPITK